MAAPITFAEVDKDACGMNETGPTGKGSGTYELLKILSRLFKHGQPEGLKDRGLKQ